MPLEPEELDVLGDLVATRLAAIVVISAWRVARYPENAEYIQAWDDDSWRLLELIGDVGCERFSEELGAARAPVPTDALVERRADALGAVLTELTYSDPVHVASGEGAWLVDVDGRRLLDAYNNVPVVGHCHPRVTEAVVRQTRTLNTHARYVYEPLVELAERLLASMPPEAGLDTVMLVNSGSEANDIAWRIAAGVTGRDGAIVTQHAYHGVTAAIADLSPEEWPEGFNAPRVARIPADAGGEAVAAAAAGLAEAGHALAATFIDAGLTSDGVHPLTPERLAAIVQATHDAGGLFVADEVQVGYGRSGEHLWTFAHLGVAPDFVTLGKPMGNGYPVAAVLTRREIVEGFAFAGTCLQHVRRQPGRGAGRPRSARRDPRRADHPAREARRRGCCCAARRAAGASRRDRRRARSRAARSAFSSTTPRGRSRSSTRCASAASSSAAPGRETTS